MQYFGLTDVGCIRVNNEDSFEIKAFSPKFLAAVVADGMGGHSGGREASSFAVQTAIKAIEDASEFFPKYTDNQIENFIKNTVIKINKSLYQKAAENEELSGMGTTLVVCIVYDGRYYVSNVGDSRLYIYSSNLAQITKDHSYVSELVDMGVITKEQARTHPNKNVITRAIGTEQSVVPDIFKGKLKENDQIIICSDGLTNMVSEEVISDILENQDTAEEKTYKLVSKAKENGGTDNITVVTIKSENGGVPDNDR